jgi:hypothetical protein
MPNISKALTLFVPLGTGVGLAYLFGYWGSLGANPLEYIGFSDVIRISLQPMFISFAAVVLGLFLTETGRRFFPLGGGQKTEIGRQVKKYDFVFWSVWFVVMVTIFIRGHDPTKWFVLASMGSTFSVLIGNAKTMHVLLPDDRARSVILFLVMFLPPWSFASGRMDAADVRNGRTNLALDTSRVPDQVDLRSTPHAPIIYVGRLGDRIFFYETLTKRTVLVREDQLPVFALREK